MSSSADYWPHLVAQDKLCSPETAAQDIASLAMSSRSLNVTAKGVLWGLLGQEYSMESATTAKSLVAVPKQERWDYRFLSSKTRKLKNYSMAKALARQHAEEVPAEVPAHVFGEVARLRCLGLAASNARKEFQLTDKELRGVERVDKSRGSLGTAHIHALSGLVRAAQAKYGSMSGMAAAARERAAKRERAAASKQEAADERRRALAEAAGLQEISADVAAISCVDRYLRTPNSKGAHSQQQLAHFVHLADWAARYAGLGEVRKSIIESEIRFLRFKVYFRDADDGDIRYFGDYYSKAYRAAADVTDWEEEDCIRLACQNWAKPHGSMRSALARPEVPPEGALRDSLAAVLRQAVVASNVALDAGLDDQPDMPHHWEFDWSAQMGRNLAGFYTASPAFFFGDFSHFIQVALSARSVDELDVLQDRVRPNLVRMARFANRPTSVLHFEALLMEFEAPPREAGEALGAAAAAEAAEAGPAAAAAQQQRMQAGQAAADASGCIEHEYEEAVAPSAHRCLLFLGVTQKEAPISLLTGQPHSLHHLQGPINMSNLDQTICRWFEGAWKPGFDAYQPGMAVRLRLLTASQVPESVREAAAEG